MRKQCPEVMRKQCPEVISFLIRRRLERVPQQLTMQIPR
jgi:hypothetical protein